MRLTAAAANRICMDQCRAGCCRGPLYLPLMLEEVPRFTAHAAALGIATRIVHDTHGAAVRFLDHDGERCPMLEDATSACRIYPDRPRRCREFPDRPRPDCAISSAR